MLLSTWGTAECFWCPASKHTNKHTHRCWFPSGTGPHGVGYHLGPQSPLQGKHQWLSLIPHSRSVLKGPWTDRDGGDTPHQWAWPAASGTFSPHSYHPIKYGTQRQRRRDWSKRRGRWGDSTPSL